MNRSHGPVFELGPDGSRCSAPNRGRPGKPDPTHSHEPVRPKRTSDTRRGKPHGGSLEPRALGQSPMARRASHSSSDDAQERDCDGTCTFGRDPVSPDGFKAAPGGLAGDDRGGGC